MARIRTIKPEFFTSEDIVSRSPLARLLYIALWCESDKEGRLAWKPATFKLRYMPGDDCDIKALCGELVDAGLVVLYGDALAFIPTFGAHQHINPRESDSQLPAPPDEARVATRRARVGHASPRVGHAQVGREGKGKEGASIDASPAALLAAGKAKKSKRGQNEHPLFADFYAAYPRKIARPAAVKAFNALNPDRGALNAMLAAITAQGLADRCAAGEGRFVPHPATWLNGRRWEDQPATEKQEPRRAGAGLLDSDHVFVMEGATS